MYSCVPVPVSACMHIASVRHCVRGASHDHNLESIAYKSAFTSVTVCSTHSAYMNAQQYSMLSKCAESFTTWVVVPVFGHAGHVELHSNASG